MKDLTCPKCGYVLDKKALLAKLNIKSEKLKRTLMTLSTSTLRELVDELATLDVGEANHEQTEVSGEGPIPSGLSSETRNVE